MGAAGASPDRSRGCHLLPRPGLPVPEARPGRGTWGIRAAGAGRTRGPEPPQPPARSHARRQGVRGCWATPAASQAAAPGNVSSFSVQGRRECGAGDPPAGGPHAWAASLRTWLCWSVCLIRARRFRPVRFFDAHSPSSERLSNLSKVAQL